MWTRVLEPNLLSQHNGTETQLKYGDCTTMRGQMNEGGNDAEEEKPDRGKLGICIRVNSFIKLVGNSFYCINKGLVYLARMRR